MASNSQNREHDVVVYGATGFVGKLTALYLAEHGPADAKIALGGRSKEKLERTRAEIGGRAADWPLVVADSSDEAAVAALAASTRAVATTVGPYAKLRACRCWAPAPPPARTTPTSPARSSSCAARSTTHHETAKGSGAKIVHACGFDSIPSDLGVLELHELRERQRPRRARRHDLRRHGHEGRASGGTVDSLRGQIDEAKRDPVGAAGRGGPVRAQPGPRGGAGPRQRA